MVGGGGQEATPRRAVKREQSPRSQRWGSRASRQPERKLTRMETVQGRSPDHTRAV